MAYLLLEPIIILLIAGGIVVLFVFLIKRLAENKNGDKIADIVNSIENIYKKTENFVDSTGQQIADYEVWKEEQEKEKQEKRNKKRKEWFKK